MGSLMLKTYIWLQNRVLNNKQYFHAHYFVPRLFVLDKIFEIIGKFNVFDKFYDYFRYYFFMNPKIALDRL